MATHQTRVHSFQTFLTLGVFCLIFREGIQQVNGHSLPTPVLKHLLPEVVVPENITISQQLESLYNVNEGLKPLECAVIDSDDTIKVKNGIISPIYRWKNLDVFLDPAYNTNERTLVNNAMYRLSQVLPCVGFRIYPIGSRPSGDYVNVVKGSGCSSAVGKRGGGQQMSLASPGCMHIGTIMHEMIHALGFHHEQSRPDRDDYVKILWENIQAGREHNFNKLSSSDVTSFGVAYNPRSIMHYGAYDFSVNGRPTIQSKDGSAVGSTGELQSTDINKLKRMYNC